jgi:ribosomal-protein-alanine N-acetyltransferase
VTVAHESVFLAAARRSRTLHAPWVHPPQTAARFRRYVSQHTGERHIGYLAFSADGELVGVINISEIVRGVFQSAYLG